MLDTVTITGADDKVDPLDLVDLSEEFPFVEWGILHSPKRTGTPRYPSRAWVNEVLYNHAKDLRLSAHLCGGQAMAFVNDPNTALEPTGWCRVQLNGIKWGPEQSKWFAQVEQLPYRIVMQAADRSQVAAWALAALAMTSVAEPNSFDVLLDASGGTGKVLEIDLEQELRDPDRGLRHLADLLHSMGMMLGLAGGLGPDEVGPERTSSLKEVFWHMIGREAPYSVDMETNVRTNDELDLEKVRTALRLAAVVRQKEREAKMAVEFQVKRTVYVAKCDCGAEPTTLESDPPRERRCACGKWNAFEEVSFTGPDTRPRAKP